MTNSDIGHALIDHVVLPTLSDHLAWPTEPDRLPGSVAAAGTELAGSYRAGKGTFELQPSGDDLELRAPGQAPIRLVRDAGGGWRCPTLRLDVRFPDARTLLLHQDAPYVEDVVATRI